MARPPGAVPLGEICRAAQLFCSITAVSGRQSSLPHSFGFVISRIPVVRAVVDCDDVFMIVLVCSMSITFVVQVVGCLGGETYPVYYGRHGIVAGRGRGRAWAAPVGRGELSPVPCRLNGAAGSAARAPGGPGHRCGGHLDGDLCRCGAVAVLPTLAGSDERSRAGGAVSAGGHWRGRLGEQAICGVAQDGAPACQGPGGQPTGQSHGARPSEAAPDSPSRRRPVTPLWTSVVLDEASMRTWFGGANPWITGLVDQEWVVPMLVGVGEAPGARRIPAGAWLTNAAYVALGLAATPDAVAARQRLLDGTTYNGTRPEPRPRWRLPGKKGGCERRAEAGRALGADRRPGRQNGVSDIGLRRQRVARAGLDERLCASDSLSWKSAGDPVIPSTRRCSTGSRSSGLSPVGPRTSACWSRPSVIGSRAAPSARPHLGLVPAQPRPPR